MKKFAIFVLMTALCLSSMIWAEVNFAQEIYPIFEGSCIGCHQTKREVRGRIIKPKAGLVLTKRQGIIGEQPKVIYPGAALKSALYQLINLPAGDPDIMPAMGDKLSAADIDLIKNWINEGAKFGDWGKQEAPKDKQTEKRFSVPTTKSPEEILARKVTPLSEDTLKLAVPNHARILKLAMGNPLVYLTFSGNSELIKKENLQNLAPLGKNLVHLDLSRLKVGDETLATLLNFINLCRLNLSYTRISSAGLSHLVNFKHLYSLNLHHTRVNASAIPFIKSMVALKKLYLFGTDFTEEDVRALQAVRPDIKINLSIEQQH